MNAKIKAYAPAPRDAKPLSPTELLAALRAALDAWERGSPFWIFAYGSLMWNPSFTYDAATCHGARLPRPSGMSRITAARRKPGLC